jgi:hypothetical protein
MRILLQQKETGRYLDETGAWVCGSSTAMEFMVATAAIDFAVANRMTGLQVVLKFDEHKCDIVLPISASELPPAAPSARPNGASRPQAAVTAR